MFFFRQLLVLVFICFATFTYGATLLPSDEVEALQQIAKTLGKTDWNFSADPCQGEWGWAPKNQVRDAENFVNCTCYNNTVCHVTSITLKSQNLQGTLPPELVRLPYIQVIDFTRNYLNGTIPPEWASTQLSSINLIGNRLTGPIPREFGNLTTLANLTLEYNLLSGPIPQELGNIQGLQRLLLTSNNFTGELPSTLAKLTNLSDFRIGDNQFTGQIPNFIQNWTNLQKLFIQGSGLKGPIPTGISLLTQLSDLRISDLNGSEMSFPPLSNLMKLEKLILRSCNLTGQLPEYLKGMTNLKTLDLSFNKLTGPIPSSFGALNADFIYLTGNMLSGPIPSWMQNARDYIDLSYNNLTLGDSRSLNCPQRKLNLFKSSFEANTTSGVASCLRSFDCPQSWYSLYINCGGGEVPVQGNIIYETDTDPGAAARFFQSGTNWAFSSTGHFIDDGRPKDTYIWTNTSSISASNPQLYMDARLSPLSLTYYGFCLLNGNYTVRLHFAEIMFTDDKTYESLGRRLFDIYIQGKLVLKDFNIVNEAGGVGKEIIKPFTAVVSDGTLEIRFYWAGKGTTGIPYKGVYGPLISAISVDPDFQPPSYGNSISAGTVVGIVIPALFAMFLVLVILWWKGCLRRKGLMEEDLKGLDLHTGSFTLRQIKAATNNFDADNKIGEGGFGSVYKGLLSDGTIIAVKQLSSKSKQGNREFVNELGTISALQHPHLVKLYGCCTEGNQLLLVYEYMENNSLARALFGPEEYQLNLDWPTRHKICIGIARGLAYLHEESRLKIVHRDIKATNVLLDKYLNPKISDFGLAKLSDEDNTHISTRIAGTFGYMAPEYAMRGYLTDKADVYSYGIVVLEIVSGKSNTSCRSKEESFYLLDWALVLKEKGGLEEIIDPRLGSNYNKEEVMSAIEIALMCTNVSPAVRPAMSTVVSMLEGRQVDQEFLTDSASSAELMPKEMKKEHQQEDATDISTGQIHNMSIDGPFTAPSTSTADLYPVFLDSSYWEKRG